MREIVFGFRVDESERRMIQQVASRLERNESDALRFLVREAVTALGLKAEGQAVQVKGKAQTEANHANVN